VITFPKRFSIAPWIGSCGPDQPVTRFAMPHESRCITADPLNQLLYGTGQAEYQDSGCFRLSGCGFGSVGFLVQSDHISAGVAEPGSDFRRVSADGLHDFAPVRDDRVEGRRNAVDHDVKEQARRPAGRSAANPGSAHFSSRVIEGNSTVPTLPDRPAEDLSIKIGRALDVRGGHLDITNFAVS